MTIDMQEPSGGEQLVAYYLGYEKDFKRFFKKSKKKASEKDIHRFRVSTKKIKSIFNLIDLCDENFNGADVFESYKKLFKTAGRVRECQVNFSRFTNLNVDAADLDDFKKWQKKRLKAYKKKFAKAISEFDYKTVKNTRKRIHKSCESLSSEMLTSKVIEFIAQKKSDIEELSLSELTIPTIHRIRIQIKQITTILGLYNSLDIVGHKPVNEQILRGYENELGQWHDHVILRDALVLYEQDVIREKPNNTIREIIDFLEEEDQKFTGSINGFVSKVMKTISSDIL